MSYLTPSELFELTELSQYAAQIRWLKENRWKHAVTARGEPRVAKEYYHAKMVTIDETPDELMPQVFKINTAALTRRM